MRNDDNDDEPNTTRTAFLIGTLVLVAVIAGGYYFFFVRKPGKPRLHATEGIVLFQGKPAVGARVTLIPEDQPGARFLPMGTVAEDGTFKLTTFSTNDGAPAGRYRVGIVRSRLDGSELADLKKKHTPEEMTQILAEKAQDPLFSKYADAGLKAEIPAPGKQLRFELE